MDSKFDLTDAEVNEILVTQELTVDELIECIDNYSDTDIELITKWETCQWTIALHTYRIITKYCK